MNRPEYSKRVFISYRRKDADGKRNILAKNLLNDLKPKGFDIFYDTQSIGAGYFYTQIIDNIKVREHYVLVLEKGTLDRCGERSDWIRREIETAIDSKRNIILCIYTGRANKVFNPDKPIENQPDSNLELNELNRFLYIIGGSFGLKDNLKNTSDSDLELSEEEQKRKNILEKLNVKIFKSGDKNFKNELANYLKSFNLNENPVPYYPEIEQEIPNLKRRLFVLSLEEDEDYKNPILVNLCKLGFDIVDGSDYTTTNEDENIFRRIVQRDAIILIGTEDAIQKLADKRNNLYHQLRFAQDYNMLIIPITFDSAIYYFSQLPEELLPVFLLQSFPFPEEERDDFIKDLTNYLTGFSTSVDANNREAEENRRRGIIAYGEKRYREGDLHFELATTLSGAKTHVKAVAHMIWGIQRFKSALTDDKLIHKERINFYEQALNNFRRTTELFPKSIATWLYIGRAYIEIEKYNEAIISFDEILKIVDITWKLKEDDEEHQNTATLDSRDKQEQEQEQEKERKHEAMLVSRDELTPDFLVWYGIVLHRQEAYQKAYDLLRQISDTEVFHDTYIKLALHQARAECGNKIYPNSDTKLIESDYEKAIQILDEEMNLRDEAGNLKEALFAFRLKAHEVNFSLQLAKSRFSKRSEPLITKNDEVKQVIDEMNEAILAVETNTVQEKAQLLVETLKDAIEQSQVVGAGADLLVSHLHEEMGEVNKGRVALESSRGWEIPENVYDIKLLQQTLDARFADLSKDISQKDTLKLYEEAWETLQKSWQTLEQSRNNIDPKLIRLIGKNLASMYNLENMRAKAKQIKELLQSMNALEEIYDLIDDIRAYINDNSINQADELHKTATNMWLALNPNNYTAPNLKSEYLAHDIRLRDLRLLIDLKNGTYEPESNFARETIKRAETLYEEFPQRLLMLCFVYKEIADTYRAKQQFQEALEYYQKIIETKGDKALQSEFVKDVNFAIAMTEGWLKIPDAPDTAAQAVDKWLGAEAIDTDVYKNSVKFIPSDTFDAHLMRATAFQKIGDIEAVKTECERAKAIFGGKENPPANRNQEILLVRLNKVCSF